MNEYTQYRIWNPDDQEHIYIGDTGARWVILPDGTVFDIKWGEFHNNYIVLECTGKKDCKGTLIYEGDILDFDEREWEAPDFTSIVKWDENEAKWDFGGGSVSDLSSYRTIVGNIYKYPMFNFDE